MDSTSYDPCVGSLEGSTSRSWSSGDIEANFFKQIPSLSSPPPSPVDSGYGSASDDLNQTYGSQEASLNKSRPKKALKEVQHSLRPPSNACSNTRTRRRRYRPTCAILRLAAELKCQIFKELALLHSISGSKDARNSFLDYGLVCQDFLELVRSEYFGRHFEIYWNETFGKLLKSGLLERYPVRAVKVFDGLYEGRGMSDVDWALQVREIFKIVGPTLLNMEVREEYMGDALPQNYLYDYDLGNLQHLGLFPSTSEVDRDWLPLSKMPSLKSVTAALLDDPDKGMVMDSAVIDTVLKSGVTRLALTLVLVEASTSMEVYDRLSSITHTLAIDTNRLPLLVEHLPFQLLGSDKLQHLHIVNLTEFTPLQQLLTLSGSKLHRLQVTMADKKAWVDETLELLSWFIANDKLPKLTVLQLNEVVAEGVVLELWEKMNGLKEVTKAKGIPLMVNGSELS